MRKLLFALVALAACADNTDTMVGGGGGSGSGSGSDDGGGGGGDDGGGGDVSAADKQQDYDDVAAALGANLSASELVAMIDSVNMAYGRMPDGFTLSQGPDYVLLDGTRGGLTVQYKLYCRDDADLYTPCNGAENHAHVRTTYSGSLSEGDMTMDGVERTAAWIVRDLLLPTPRIGGEGTDSFASHLATGDYTLVVNDSLDHIKFDSAAPGTPIAGGVDLTINIDRTRASADPAQRTFDVAARVDFDGSDNAVLTLDGSEIYNLTLSTGAVVRAQ